MTIVTEIVESMNTMLNVHVSVPRMKREEFSTQIILKLRAGWWFPNRTRIDRGFPKQQNKKQVGIHTDKKTRLTGFPKQQNKKQVGGSQKEENEVDMVAQTAE